MHAIVAFTQILILVVMPALLFQAGQYYPAVIHYQRIVTWLEMEYRTRKEQQQAIKALLIMAHLNMALCYLRLQQYSQSVENCNKV